MACVSSPTCSVCINGGTHGYFKGGKGLRQGDPMSPLLFVLVMEYFSRLLMHTAEDARFRVHPGCKLMKICHLSFAKAK